MPDYYPDGLFEFATHDGVEVRHAGGAGIERHYSRQRDACIGVDHSGRQAVLRVPAG